MVKVKLDNVSATGTEKQIAKMLIKSIEKDTSGLSCHHCNSTSEVILHVDNSRMHVLRTEIKPCCSYFGEVIEHNLYDLEPA